VGKAIIRDDRHRVISGEFSVEAVAPNGRTAIGWGSCSIEERAHQDDKIDGKGKVICPGPCDGRKHFSNPDHDVPATAHTRAKNRAISDLIGAGEVSAEEIEADHLEQGEPRKPASASKGKAASPRKPASQKSKAKTATKKTPPYGGWAWLKNELKRHGISERQAADILGHPSVADWLKANPDMTREDALKEILAVSGTEPLPGTFAEPKPGLEPRPEPVSGEQLDIDEIPGEQLDIDEIRY